MRSPKKRLLLYCIERNDEGLDIFTIRIQYNVGCLVVIYCIILLFHLARLIDLLYRNTKIYLYNNKTRNE